MNAELIERLRCEGGNMATYGDCLTAADALEAADKRIAELEADLHSTHARVMQNGKAVQEAERKLAVAREAMTKAATLECNGVIRAALAQIGVDDAGT